MVKGMTCQILMIEKVAVAPTRYRAVVLTSWDHVMSDSERDPPATEAVKKSLDQNITQVTEIRSLNISIENSRFGRCRVETLQHLKHLESVLHVSKRRGNLNTLDHITHLQQRLARNLQTFISSRFLAKRRSHPHPFHDRR